MCSTLFLPPSIPLLDFPRAQVAHSSYLFVHRPFTTTLIILLPTPKCPSHDGFIQADPGLRTPVGCRSITCLAYSRSTGSQHAPQESRPTDPQPCAGSTHGLWRNHCSSSRCKRTETCGVLQTRQTNGTNASWSIGNRKWYRQFEHDCER